MTHGVREVQPACTEKIIGSPHTAEWQSANTNVNLNDIAHNNIVSERPCRQMQDSELIRIPHRHASQHFAL